MHAPRSCPKPQGVPVILMEPLGARQPYWQPFILNIINNKILLCWGKFIYIYLFTVSRLAKPHHKNGVVAGATPYTC